MRPPCRMPKLEAGPEQGVARRAIALDQEVEVCGLAEREPARPEPVDLDALGAAPARRLDPAPAAKHAHRAPGPGENRFDEAQSPRRPIAGRNRHLDGVDLFRLGGEPVEHGVRQARRRARPRENRDAGLARARVERPDAEDVVAGVGKVDAVQPRRDRGSRQGGRAALERARRVGWRARRHQRRSESRLQDGLRRRFDPEGPRLNDSASCVTGGRLMAALSFCRPKKSCLRGRSSVAKLRRFSCFTRAIPSTRAAAARTIRL